MTYEQTPINKTPSKTAVRKQAKAELSEFNTLYILWHLVCKHKTAFMVAGNMILILNFVLPEWFQMVLTVLGR